ncbi:MAG: hypothetical protein JXR73_19440 [Candidatus Omnitrophica bacterium]|nr:hypothetical protein [Candidatus Omnitrophota bacterium]
MKILSKENSKQFFSFLAVLILGALFSVDYLAAADKEEAVWKKSIQLVLDKTKPLKYDRGARLPLYLWPAMNPGKLTDSSAENLVSLLNDRGIGLVCSWNYENMQESLTECLPIARAQKKLGLRVNINATSLMNSFCDGSEETAHIDSAGNPFFDDAFGKKKMGCPFRLEHRIAPIRGRFDRFTEEYLKENLSVDFVFTDWEIDGPLEWNRAYDSAKRCRICQEHLPQFDDFLAYQHELRRIRSRLQRQAYAAPILERFPGALVGNYAVYPHNGWRYWYDYFERFVEGQPSLVDQNAHYRHWSNDFEGTGFTFAMPVVYPWSWTWNWYDFEPGDYRWFYNGLLVAGNAGFSTPRDVPIIAFVHWHTVDVGLQVDERPTSKNAEKPQQMSEWAYQELLWHMLLRGTDAFFLWCTEKEQSKEVELLHPVWAAAQEYGEFLESGIPVTFDVPKNVGAVVSGLRLGNQVLVRRTDFTQNQSPLTLTVSGKMIKIPASGGRCMVLPLSK